MRGRAEEEGEAESLLSVGPVGLNSTTPRSRRSSDCTTQAPPEKHAFNEIILGFLFLSDVYTLPMLKSVIVHQIAIACNRMQLN